MVSSPTRSVGLGYDGGLLERLAEQIVICAGELAGRGWAPATSGNFSLRLDGRNVAITASGRDKSRLTRADVMVVDLDGSPVASDLRPSAETPLHVQIYRRWPAMGCVLHTHSVRQTVAARLFAHSRRIRLEGYELLKAFPGQATHVSFIDLPVVANDQDMGALAAEVERVLDGSSVWGYLIEGHGLYCWGQDLAQARRHLEAFEFLVTCELELRRLSR